MFIKKNLILTSVDNDEKKAVLNLEYNERGVNGKLRLYNFSSQPSGIITLGIYFNSQVYKAGLIYVGNMLYNFNIDLPRLTDDFSCAVINFVGGLPTPILYGTSGSAKKDDLDKTIDLLGEAKGAHDVERVLDKVGIQYDDELQQDIEEVINETITKDDVSLCASTDCENCVYKKFYHSTLSPQKEIVSQKSFYLDMKDELEKIFKANEEEEYLEHLLPQSKWAKVMLDKGEYYVVGIIKEDDEIKYICYGVPGVYAEEPPKELSGFPVWFPLDENNERGFGYWLSYQDAESGESVKAVVV